MCGRYSLAVADAKVVYERFALSDRTFDIQPRYNIASGQMNPVVVSQSPNTQQPMVWGLIPHWAKDESMKFKTINARVEGIDKKATYRDPLKHHRCLVPATGFYEWDKSTEPSTPYYFGLKDEELFAFAGLFDVWRDPHTQKELYSYTILTCPANGVVGKILTRMPVILHKEDQAVWLNPDFVEPEHLYPLLSPLEDSAMEDYRVSHEVNHMRNDNGELIKPVDSKQLAVRNGPEGTYPSRGLFSLFPVQLTNVINGLYRGDQLMWKSCFVCGCSLKIT